MTAPVLSPDGKFMWTGNEWIPAPPNPGQSANINLQDSAVAGDVNITQNNTVINENKGREECPNCGAIGSVLIPRKQPDCKQIDFCNICFNDVMDARFRKVGKLGDTFWDPHYRKFRRCNKCWVKIHNILKE